MNYYSATTLPSKDAEYVIGIAAGKGQLGPYHTVRVYYSTDLDTWVDLDTLQPLGSEMVMWRYELGEPTTRTSILEKAKECVNGKREQDYGSPEDNFKIIADLWTAYKGVDFTSLDVAMMMALLKIGRIKNGGGTGDSFVDLAGYAACGGEIAETKVKGE